MSNGFTLKINNDVAMAATLRQATADDRQVVEEKKVQVDASQQAINLAQSDIEAKHGEIDNWQQQVATDKNTVAQDRQTVATDKAEINTKAQTIATQNSEIGDKHSDIDSWQQYVNADRLQVAADKNHIDNQVTVVDQKVSSGLNSLDQKSTAEQQVIASARADAVQEIESTRDDSRNAVVTEKSSALLSIQNTGTSQKSRVTAEGSSQFNRIQSRGNQAEQDVTNTGTVQVNRVVQAGDERLSVINEAAAPVMDFAEQFGDIDAAINHTDSSATSAANSASTGLSHKQSTQQLHNQTQALKNQTQQLRDDTAEVATGGTGSLTPEPGKLAIADADGHIADNWLTPSLLAQAMAAYPYNGITGSVDKGALFSCPATTPNELILKARKWKIGTQFITVPQTTITLAAAESTADKALAWDDIVLHDDGTYQHYRSYTAHRTATGYDESAIMAEHGYTKNDVDLWSKSGTGAVIVGRIARRNQGAYHPVWNSEGSSVWKRERSPVEEERSYANTWWHWQSTLPERAEDAFDGVKSHMDYRGKIGDVGYYFGRADKKPYDAITLDDITPLYTSAERFTDRQALLFDMFNKAVAGETFNGAEGIGSVFTITAVDPESYGGIYGASVTVDAPLVNAFRTQPSLVAIWVNGRRYATTSLDAAAYRRLYIVLSEFESNPFGVGDQLYIENTASPYFNGYPQSDSARPHFTNIDIIGAQSAMPQEWLDNGIPGNWLAVGEKGESLIPDGTEKNYKLSRKCLDAYLILKTADNGATWSDITASWEDDLQGAANAKTETLAATDCVMVFYKTAANPFELSNALPLISEPRLIASDRPLLTDRLINKVAAGSTTKKLSVSEYQLDADEKLVTKKLIHAPQQLTRLPALKASVALVDVNGSACLMCQTQEITGADDNSNLTTVDKQATATDNAANTVIANTKIVRLNRRLS